MGYAEATSPWLWQNPMAIGAAQHRGGVAEWLKATVLKTVNVQAFVGSNPTPSVVLSSSLWCDTAGPCMWVTEPDWW